MLFETMIADVRDRVGETVADFWTDTFIKRKLNEGVRRFSNEERWPWLQTTMSGIPVAQGQPEIELIDDVALARHFNIALRPTGDAADLAIVLPKRVDTPRGLELRRVFHTQGEPRYYYLTHVVINTYAGVSGSVPALVVRLVPTPNRAYVGEYHFYRNPVEMVAGTDEPLLPEAYHEAVVAWATAQCWTKELNGSMKAQEEYNIYNAVLDQARNDLEGFADDDSLTWGKVEPEPRRDPWPNELSLGLPLGP